MEERANFWTVDQLKEYLEARLDDHRVYADRRVDEVEKAFTTHLEEATAALNAAMEASSRAIAAALDASNAAIAAAFAASDKAIDKAESATKDRFESVNEFRGQLRDQATTMLTRELFEQAMRDVRTQQAALQSRVEELAGQLRELYARTEGGKDTTAAFRANVAAAVAIVAVIVAIALPLLGG